MGKKLFVLGSSFVVLGVALFIVGACLKWTIFPKILEDQVYENIKLENGTEGYDAFVKPPVAVYMRFMFFNVDNVDAVLKGEKPKVSEKGPYYYKESRRKEDLNPVDYDKLHYGQYMEYEFDQEMTDKNGCPGCKDSDSIVVLNGALAAVGALLKTNINLIPEDYTSIVFGLMNQILDADSSSPYYVYKESIFKEVQVKELVFDGYETGLIKAFFNVDHILSVFFQDLLGTPDVQLGLQMIQELLDGLPSGTLPFEINVFDIYNSYKELINNPPDQIAGGTFGLFKGKNATKANSYYLINTGKFEKHNFMKLLEVNGRTDLPENWWPSVGPTPSANASGVKGVCREIYGTDGQQFPPFLDPNEEFLWIYVGELCRSIWMQKEKEHEILGVPVYRYRPAKDVFLLSSSKNLCYCQEFNRCAKPQEGIDEWDTSGCAETCKDGVLNVGPCYGGAPIMMTQPHFLDADESLFAAVDGISEPNHADHETFLDVEPITGATMGAHKRIQINIPLVNIPNFGPMAGVPELIFPIMWADENAELDQENADKFIEMVLTPTKIVDGIAIGLGMVVGAVLFVVGAFLAKKNSRSSRSNQKKF